MSRVAKKRTEQAKRLLNPPEERPEEETKKEFNGTLTDMLRLAGLKRRNVPSGKRNNRTS